MPFIGCLLLKPKGTSFWTSPGQNEGKAEALAGSSPFPLGPKGKALQEILIAFNRPVDLTSSPQHLHLLNLSTGHPLKCVQRMWEGHPIFLAEETWNLSKDVALSGSASSSSSAVNYLMAPPGFQSIASKPNKLAVRKTLFSFKRKNFIWLASSARQSSKSARRGKSASVDNILVWPRDNKNSSTFGLLWNIFFPAMCCAFGAMKCKEGISLRRAMEEAPIPRISDQQPQRVAAHNLDDDQDSY